MLMRAQIQSCKLKSFSTAPILNAQVTHLQLGYLFSPSSSRPCYAALAAPGHSQHRTQKSVSRAEMKPSETRSGQGDTGRTRVKALSIACTEFKSNMTKPFIISTTCRVHAQPYDSGQLLWAPERVLKQLHGRRCVSTRPQATRWVCCRVMLTDTHPPCSGARRGAVGAPAHPDSSVIALKCCHGLSGVWEGARWRLDYMGISTTLKHMHTLQLFYTCKNRVLEGPLCCSILSRS